MLGTQTAAGTKSKELPAQVAATLNLLLASHSMLEQGLDLVAVGGGALRIVTGRCVNQQRHGALQLLLPVSPL